MMSARPDTLEGGFRPLQIYEQVAEKIRDEIRAGRYAAESRLPSERETAGLFQVGRPAVRRRSARRTSRVHEAIRAPTSSRRRSTCSRSAATATGRPSPISARRRRARRAADPGPRSRASRLRGRADPGAERYLAQMETITDVDDPHQRAHGTRATGCSTGNSR